jgi:hypothetical protein
MDRKAISAFLVGCEPKEFMVYRDEGMLGSVVVGPDGKKYRFSCEDLVAGDLKLNPPKPKPAPKPKTKAPALPKPMKKKPLKRKSREIDK